MSKSVVCLACGGKGPFGVSEKLPQGFAVGDDATTELAIKLAEQDRELESLYANYLAIMEETVKCGFRGGDRQQTLANVRAMRMKLQALNHSFDSDAEYQHCVSMLYEEWRERLEATQDFDEWKVAEIIRLRNALRSISELPLGHHDGKRIAKRALA